MKVNKIVLAAAVAALALVPVVTMSKDNGQDTIVLTEENTLILNSQVDGESVAKLVSQAKKLDADMSSIVGRLKGKNKKPLYLFLNTPGGSIHDGLELIDTLHGIGRPVHTITLFAASMGFQIAQNMDDRLILRNGVLMSHRAAGQFSGSFGGEAPSQIDNRAHLWNQRVTELDQQTVKRTNGKQTLQSYQHQYASEMWITGQESVAQGYADKIANVKCDKSLDGTTENQGSFFGTPFTYELSKCPLITAPTNVKVSISTTRGMITDDEFVRKGGEFGASCLTSSNVTKLCALDTSLNSERIKEIKKQFATAYFQKLRGPVGFDFHGVWMVW